MQMVWELGPAFGLWRDFRLQHRVSTPAKVDVTDRDSGEVNLPKAAESACREIHTTPTWIARDAQPQVASSLAPLLPSLRLLPECHHQARLTGAAARAPGHLQHAHPYISNAGAILIDGCGTRVGNEIRAEFGSLLAGAFRAAAT